MNVFILSIPREMCKLRNGFCWCSNLNNDDITSYRPGLKTGVKNDIFWSELGSAFGYTPTPGVPPPRGNRMHGHFDQHLVGKLFKRTIHNTKGIIGFNET